MRLSIAADEAMGLLEAAHEGHATLEAWLDTLVDAVRRLVPGAVFVTATAARRLPSRWEFVGGDRSHRGPLSEFGKMMPSVRPTELDDYMRRPMHVATYARATCRGDAVNLIGESFMAQMGVAGSLAFLSQAGHGVSMAIMAMLPNAISVPAATRLVLSRIATHVESALRLRLTQATPIAVVGVDGRVHDADGEGTDATVRAALARQAVTVERQRRRADRRRPEAIASWSALVGGRFGLVETSEGGRRRYHFFRNPPHVWAGRALSETEGNVLELTARGLSGKLVAYTLGLSEARVSHALAAAALKLGVSSRTELARIAALVLQPDGLTRAAPDLTSAEREVLTLLREGWTNAAIARERSVSPRTVANQVAAILRKTGRDSRRALAAAR